MEIRNVPIGTVKPYEKNPRHNDNAVDAVANSIREFGWKQPIVVDKDNVVIVGHTRLKAAQKLGLTEVPVLIADDLTPEKVKAYRLADNKTNELAFWDNELLDIELGDITDIDMEQFGFDLDEYPDIDELDANEEPDEKTVVRLVFQDYKSYSLHEIEIKEFADSIGASVTVGK